MRPSPEDKQQFKTIRYILKNRTANCTGYVTIIGSILKALELPYTLRVTGILDPQTNQIAWIHIYILSGGYVMDATIGQDQNGSANFDNRKINSTFNSEYPYRYKKDFDYPMITVLNGRNNLNMDPATAQAMSEIAMSYKDPETGRMDINALSNDVRTIIDLGQYGAHTLYSFVNTYFNPCKRGCDVRYPFNIVKRRACKRDCIRQNLQNLTQQDLQRLYDFSTARRNILNDPNLLLYLGGGFLIYKLATR
jgi:hypothetical protein